VDDHARLRERREGDEEGSEATRVIEVGVADDDVPDRGQREPRPGELTQEAGAAAGVDEQRRAVGQREGEAGLRARR